jgi:hypothetical protein
VDARCNSARSPASWVSIRVGRPDQSLDPVLDEDPLQDLMAPVVGVLSGRVSRPNHVAVAAIQAPRTTS